MCNEETLQQIEQRYQVYNSHSESYTWKFLTSVLAMDKPLDGNGIPELAAQFDELSIDRNEFVPELQVYYNDDLKPSN